MSNFSYSRSFKGVADVFLRTPDLYRPLLEFIESVMVGPSGLTKVEREVIAAHVSRVNGCTFCVEAHRATLTALGAPDALVANIERAPDVEGLGNHMRALLGFAEKLTSRPASITQADIGVLTALGIPEQTVEDTINVVSLFNYVNRLVDAFGVEGSPEYLDAVGRALAKNGYAKLLPKKAA